MLGENCLLRVIILFYLTHIINFYSLLGAIDQGTKLVVSGGFDVTLAHLNITFVTDSTEILDLVSLEWTEGPKLPQALGYGSSVPFGDSFLAVGGDDGFAQSDVIYEFNSASNSWIERSEKIKTVGLYKTAFLVPNDIVNCS